MDAISASDSRVLSVQRPHAWDFQTHQRVFKTKLWLKADSRKVCWSTHLCSHRDLFMAAGPGRPRAAPQAAACGGLRGDRGSEEHPDGWRNTNANVWGIHRRLTPPGRLL